MDNQERSHNQTLSSVFDRTFPPSDISGCPVFAVTYISTQESLVIIVCSEVYQVCRGFNLIPETFRIVAQYKSLTEAFEKFAYESVMSLP